MEEKAINIGFMSMLDFGLIDALFGRRSRRFFLGAEIPDGVFAYKSKHTCLPLSELEKMLVVAACGANTSWHHMIYRARRYAPHISSYAGSAGGRTFPSAAGFHTSMTFFTDDEGVYVLDARNAGPFAERESDGSIDPQVLMDELEGNIRKIRQGRLQLPPIIPYVEAHNTWVVNHPGTFLVIPVGDVAQHVLLGMMYYLQNGSVFTDDVNRRPIPGMEKYHHLADVDHPLPLTFLDQWSFAEVAAELSTSCYAGVLMLQAMGLGGWMFDGMDPFAVLGASGDPDIPGLGFRYDTCVNWPYPNPTGLAGVMEGYCPPHYQDMRAAVDALCVRKYGPGGPFNPATPGPWKDSRKVRSAAQVHSYEFRECVALQAQYVLDTFGKFPGTVPSIFVITCLQAHHLDIEFYNTFYKPGSYLRTHAEHMERWHPGEPGETGEKK
jgi:hypothetical protein